MRAEHTDLLRITRDSVGRNAFLSAQARVRLVPLFAFGGCLLASGPSPLARCDSIIAFAMFIMLSGYRGQATRWFRGGLLGNAPSQIFETMVTLVAISMRLSPLERDLVATSLLTLLHRY